MDTPVTVTVVSGWDNWWGYQRQTTWPHLPRRTWTEETFSGRGRSDPRKTTKSRNPHTDFLGYIDPSTRVYRCEPTYICSSETNSRWILTSFLIHRWVCPWTVRLVVEYCIFHFGSGSDTSDPRGIHPVPHIQTPVCPERGTPVVRDRSTQLWLPVESTLS